MERGQIFAAIPGTSAVTGGTCVAITDGARFETGLRLIVEDPNFCAVTFKVKDYRIDGPGRYKTMTHEFIRRFLIHDCPKRRKGRQPRARLQSARRRSAGTQARGRRF